MTTSPSVEVHDMTSENPAYRQFWTEFQGYVRQSSTLLNAPRPTGKNHVHIKIDNVLMGDFKLCAALHLNGRWLKSELVVGKDYADAITGVWHERQSEWQDTIGAGLYWQTEGIQGGKLAIRKHGVDPLDRAMRPDHFRWFVETLEAFHRMLMPVVREVV